MYSADSGGSVISWHCNSHERPTKTYMTKWSIKNVSSSLCLCNFLITKSQFVLLMWQSKGSCEVISNSVICTCVEFVIFPF